MTDKMTDTVYTPEQFNEAVLAGVNRRYMGEKTGILKNVLKNNGLSMTALVIRGEDDYITPTVYLDGYYDRYKDLGTPIDRIVEEVLHTYEENMHPADRMDIGNLLDWDAVKDKVVYRLVNRRMNEELLASVPYILYLDMAVTFRITVTLHEDRDASILISSAHMTKWGIGTGELVEAAKRNTSALFPPSVKKLGEILRELSGDGAEDIGAAPPMYVLTNDQKLHGAGVILYDGMLKNLADKIGSDLYLIPSSVHEWIALPVADSSAEVLREMICSVNETMVSKDELLGDHPYRYVREDDAVICC